MEEPKSPQPSIDRGRTLIAAAIFGGALVLSWGMSNSEPRYQLAGAGDTIVRMNMDSGEMIACNQQRCVRVQPPDRAKTFGPLTFEVGDSEERPALPPPAPARPEGAR